MQMTPLTSKLITRIIGYRENKSPPNRKQTDYAVEVLQITFNVKLVFKVQEQSFADRCSSK